MIHCNLCGREAGANEYRLFKRRDEAGAKGLVVCAECERDQPRCIVCQMPMREERRAIGVCGLCLRDGLVCRACGRRIRDDWTILNGNDGPYCSECFRTRERCTLCGVPVGDPPRGLPDERPLCDRCYQTRVTDPAEAHSLFERVLGLLYSGMGMGLNIRPALSLVDHERLVELALNAIPDQADRRDKTLALFTLKGRRRVIYLQDCLPRILLIQVIAHEFAHAWEGENAPLLADPVLKEGFAEWTAYHVLVKLDAHKKAKQMMERADLYGDGLRQLLEVERGGGEPAVVDLVRHARG
jgi:hypothetical protein